jgi:hypothetical protein
MKTIYRKIYFSISFDIYRKIKKEGWSGGVLEWRLGDCTAEAAENERFTKDTVTTKDAKATKIG